ncbi:MAG: NUDIX hydrolase [Candidatus Rhabdochlamydia sp.]
MQASVSCHPSSHFCLAFEAAGCCVQYQGSLLLLKRHLSKIEGGKWCIPGGKIEAHEIAYDAAQRELREETGIVAPCLSPVFPLYVQRPHVHFIFHLYFLSLDHLPLLHIKQDEHTEERWVRREDIDKINLISGGKEIMDLFYTWKDSALIL